jgi:hypothetical protein
MATPYELTSLQLKREILAQKAIYKFRMFMYSLNRDVRQSSFRISRDYLENELNNLSITATEFARVQALLNHWNWQNFSEYSTNWWSVLSSDYSTSVTLITIINLWTDDINVFDNQIPDTATDGLR